MQSGHDLVQELDTGSCGKAVSGVMEDIRFSESCSSREVVGTVGFLRENEGILRANVNGAMEITSVIQVTQPSRGISYAENQHNSLKI